METRLTSATKEMIVSEQRPTVIIGERIFRQCLAGKGLKAIAQSLNADGLASRIEVDDSEVKIYYTIPMPPYSVSEETVGVLPFVHHG